MSVVEADARLPGDKAFTFIGTMGLTAGQIRQSTGTVRGPGQRHFGWRSGQLGFEEGGAAIGSAYCSAGARSTVRADLLLPRT